MACQSSQQINVVRGGGETNDPIQILEEHILLHNTDRRTGSQLGWRDAKSHINTSISSPNTSFIHSPSSGPDEY
jgi:hypothetical protein